MHSSVDCKDVAKSVAEAEASATTRSKGLAVEEERLSGDESGVAFHWSWSLPAPHCVDEQAGQHSATTPARCLESE